MACRHRPLTRFECGPHNQGRPLIIWSRERFQFEGASFFEVFPNPQSERKVREAEVWMGGEGGRVSFLSPPQWGRNRFRRLGSLELAPGVIWQFTRCHREIKSRAPHCQLSPAASRTFIFFRFRCPPRSFPNASAFFSSLLCWFFFSFRVCFR